jgi:predicted enzyme related to lactoylglutathione lyase
LINDEGPAQEEIMPKPVVHFEIGCRDKLKTSEFFSKLFEWEIDQGPMGTIAPGPGGITGHITSLGHEPHNYVTVYIEVEELESYLARVHELGGKTVIPPIDLPIGSFAWFADIDGNTLGLWKPKK